MNGRRGVLVAVVFVAALSTALTAIVLTRDDTGPTRANAALRAHDRLPSLSARFAVLRQAHSNRCGMPASAIDAMPSSARLQGACCFPMNYSSYVTQVRELNHRYASVDVIPTDPYNIQVSLAKRLIGYQRIHLTSDEQRTYNRAVPLSDTKGPCCCPCWRWTAFGGQAKYLITRRRYKAQQIAAVWSLEEGCGGPSHTHT